MPQPSEAPTGGEAYYDYPQVGRIYFHSSGKTDANFIYREIFKDHEYLGHGVELRAGDTVFDVGANVGMFSLYARQACGGELTLFAFEPIPLTFQFLRKNLGLHGMLDSGRVHLFPIGLTCAGGPQSVEFTYYANAPSNATMRPADKQHDIASLRRWLDDPGYFFAEVRKRRGMLFPLYWAIYGLIYPIAVPFLRRKLKKLYEPTTLVCELTTMSQVIQNHGVVRIDLLKIDVEGAELDVLLGIGADDWPKIRQIVLEVHDIDGRLETVQRLLRDQGFEHIVIERPALFDRVKLNIHNLYAHRGEDRSACVKCDSGGGNRILPAR